VQSPFVVPQNKGYAHFHSGSTVVVLVSVAVVVVVDVVEFSSSLVGHVHGLGSGVVVVASAAPWQQSSLDNTQ
jgi:hypothetical protein